MPDRADHHADGNVRKVDGGTASFPYDRMTVERFRETFPRARWSDERKAWFVPGKTAARRIDKWLAQEASRADAYADAKGRDAYEFDPIESPYLEIGDAGLRVNTPYSRTVVEELRNIAGAHWDSDLRLWHVPFRSYEELRRRWPLIEAAGRRNEPEERKRRAEARKATDNYRIAQRRSAERRRRRFPLPNDDLPPLQRPVTTDRYGIVVFADITGELVVREAVEEFYSDLQQDCVWGIWRAPTLDELIHVWPSKEQPTPKQIARGWWQPTLTELRAARRTARSKERR